MLCLGFEPVTSGLKTQMDPLSYDDRPLLPILLLQ